jgi:periplasmic divalent cation tolerance protein
MAEREAWTDVRVVLVTAPDRAIAERLVRTLVEEGLVACGNIVPAITSIYGWQGQIEQADEVLIILKTAEGNVSRLTQRVPRLHPYEVPEVLVLPVIEGHPAYLDWVLGAGAVKPGGQSS